MNEVSGRGLYPGPGINKAQQDRLRKCSLTSLQSAQHWHARRNKEDNTMTSKCLKAQGKDIKRVELTGSLLRNSWTSLAHHFDGRRNRLSILNDKSAKMNAPKRIAEIAHHDGPPHAAMAVKANTQATKPTTKEARPIDV